MQHFSIMSLQEELEEEEAIVDAIVTHHAVYLQAYQRFSASYQVHLVIKRPVVAGLFDQMNCPLDDDSQEIAGVAFMAPDKVTIKDTSLDLILQSYRADEEGWS